MLIAVLIAALVGLFLFDTVRLRRMQVQRDAAKEEVAEVKTEFLSRIISYPVQSKKILAGNPLTYLR